MSTQVPFPDYHCMRLTPYDPSLVGILDDGNLINLDGGQIEWHPNQQIVQESSYEEMVVSGYRPLTVHDGRYTYTLRFSKPLGDPWTLWFDANPDVRFRVGKVTFRLCSVCHALSGRWLYEADGYQSTP